MFPIAFLWWGITFRNAMNQKIPINGYMAFYLRTWATAIGNPVNEKGSN
jgi:hypothetical protein